MSKEICISTTPHETRLAILENDELTEIYSERENEYTLAGSIYKGRVTRVLPGMQSAFVDVGLERDAFLYVSDFLDFEDEEEEFGEVPVRPQFAEVKQSPAEVSPAGPEPEETEEEDFAEESDEPAEAADAETKDAEPQDAEGSRRWRGRRRRRGRRGGRERLPEAPQPTGTQTETAPGEPQPSATPEEEVELDIPAAVQEEQSMPEATAVDKEPVDFQGMPADYAPMLLPGESIARYSRGADAGPREESDRPPEPRPEFQS